MSIVLRKARVKQAFREESGLDGRCGIYLGRGLAGDCGGEGTTTTTTTTPSVKGSVWLELDYTSNQKPLGNYRCLPSQSSYFLPTVKPTLQHRSRLNSTW